MPCWVAGDRTAASLALDESCRAAARDILRDVIMMFFMSVSFLWCLSRC